MLIAFQRLPRLIRDRWAEFRGFNPTDRNLFHLCIEIIPIGLASGALAFNGAFVLKLGASNELIGAMASLPALVVILLTVPAARFVESRTNRRPWVVGSLAVSRVLFLLIGVIPWLLPLEAQATTIVALIIAQQVPLAFFNTAFTALIGDVCPRDRRSSLFSMRTMFLAGSVALGAFLSGIFLDQVVFPLNFQILNLVAFVLAQLSTYYVGKVQFPPAHPQPPAAERRSLRLGIDLAGVKTFFREQRAFANFNITTLVCWFGAWAAGPLYTIYLVRELQFTNSWLGANATLAQIAVLLSAPLWNRVIQRKGSLWVVMRTVLLTGLYPCLIVLFPFSAPILAIGFLNTLNDTGIGISHTAMFLDIIPPAKRSSYIAGHTVLMNMGAMIAPLISTPLSAAVGVSTVLLACGAIRFIGGALFWALPPVNREPAQETPASHATGEPSAVPADKGQ